MFSPFERLIAWRYRRARKAEGFVSVIAGFSFLGIMLGVATLIIVMSVMNGFRAELLGRILGLNGHVNVYALNSNIVPDYKVLKLKVESTQGVRMAVPMIEGQGLLSTGSSANGVLIRGITQNDFMRKPTLSESVVLGNISNFNGTNIAIGVEMAKKYNLHVGDRVTLIAPKGKVSPFGTIPRSRSYDIALIFDVGMFEYNSGFVFMPLEAAQRFFSMPDAVRSLEVFIENLNDLDRTKRAIEMTVADSAGVYDWRDMNQSFFNALQVERNVMFLILTLIIIVAAFNIISSMIMLVKDKGSDIAIMRTMGATRRSMMKIFILTGASIGFVGTFFGAVLGILFANNIESIRQWLQGLTGTELFSAEIYFLSKLPAEIDWTEVCAVILMAFFLSILATLYPAWRASKLDPVEALR
jgi:lipoprotein-releasing system permease protein